MNKFKFLKFIYLLFLPVFIFENVFAVAFNGQDTTLIRGANAICNEETTGVNVTGDVAGIGGGSAVPIDVVNLLEPLLQVDKNTRVTGNELRVQNIINFCRKTAYMAQASLQISNQAFQQIKEIATTCGDDVECLKDRAKKGSIQRQVDNLLAGGNQITRDAAKLFFAISNPDLDKKVKERNENEKLALKCVDSEKTLGYINTECREAISKGAYYEKLLNDRVQNSLFNIDYEQSEIQKYSDQSGGLNPQRTCTLTKSGKKGSEASGVPFYDADCLSYHTAPLILTEKSVENIIRLPYDQAFSESAGLGSDGTFANISTRVREGNLFDPNITNSFGSPSGQSQGSVGGYSNFSGIGGTSQDLKGAKANYDQLQLNIKSIIDLYSAGKLAFASSTLCGSLPATTRSQTVTRLDAAIAPYKAYSDDLKQKWEAASNTPTVSHIDLIMKINFDLRDKFTNELIGKVADAVKTLLNSCKGQ